MQHAAPMLHGGEKEVRSDYLSVAAITPQRRERGRWKAVLKKMAYLKRKTVGNSLG